MFLPMISKKSDAGLHEIAMILKKLFLPLCFVRCATISAESSHTHTQRISFPSCLALLLSLGLILKQCQQVWLGWVAGCGHYHSSCYLSTSSAVDTHTHTQYDRGTWHHLRLLLLCTITGLTSEINKFPFPYLSLVSHWPRAPCVRR